jgi:hypothetical protein
MSRRIQSKFIGWGFLGVESAEYGDQFSTEALQDCGYLKKLILDRRMITLNAKQYGWDADRTVNYIRRQYIKRGIIKAGQRINDKAVWKMFRWYKNRQTDLTGQVYETPRKKMRQKDFISTTPNEKKRQSILDEIALKERNIRLLKDENTKTRYTRDIEVLKRQLGKL